MKQWKTIMIFFNRLTGFMFKVVIALLVLIAFFVLFEIVMRKIIGWSVDWVIELTEYLLAYLTFLGGAHLLKIDGHLTFDLVVQRLSKRKKRFLRVISNVVGLVVALIITWYGTVATIDLFQRGIVTETILVLPKGLFALTVTFSMLLFTFQFLARCLTAMAEYRNMGKESGASKEMSF